MSEVMTLDPDRLFPADEATRAIARELYAQVRDMPIISPHGHVSAQMLADDNCFSHPTDALLMGDHYLTRLLHASGVSLEDLGVGEVIVEERRAREIWRLLCQYWQIFDGTASGYWLREQLVTVFDVYEEPCLANADAVYDQIASYLMRDAFSPQRLLAQWHIETLATTDDPLDDLRYHSALQRSPQVVTRVVPTWRPDRYLNARAAQFSEAVAQLTASVGRPADDFDGYLEALRASRQRFIEAGAVSADHGVHQPYTIALSDHDLSALYRKAVLGKLSAAEADTFEGAMLMRCAQFSQDDGLVMTIHPGVFRNHHVDTYRRFGPDTGHDIPVRSEYTRNLRPLLNAYGNDPNLHIVLFALDEAVYSREIAPLAGFYPAVYIGAPWWFLDAPDSIYRWRSAITETAGFTRGSGFIDDTRAFFSIPTRHDMARRCDAGFLAHYVRLGRISESSAHRIIKDLTYSLPRRVFKLN